MLISKTNVRALNKTLRALTLHDEHSAMVAHAKTLATLIDSYPYEAKLHSEYREALKRLLEAGSPEEADAFDALLDAINDTPAGADAPS